MAAKLLIALTLLALAGCSGESTPNPGDSPSPSPTAPNPEPEKVTYTQHMKPLFTQKCMACHNANTPERNWMDYKTAYNKRGQILRRVVVIKDMPRGFTMTDEERQLVKKWVTQGAKE